MLVRVKRFLETMNLGVSIVGGVASVLIAWFAYQIDQTVQARAESETRVNRAVALAGSQRAGEALTSLKFAANQIEEAMQRRLEGVSEEHARLGVSRSAAAEKTDPKAALVDALTAAVNGQPTLRSDLTTLLQHVTQAARCAGFVTYLGLAPGVEDSYEVLCDPKTMLVLWGEDLYSLYMIWRPVLTCDSFFKGEGLDEYHGLVRAHVEMAMQGQTAVYRTSAEADADGADSNYIILAFGPDHYCDRYQQNVASDLNWLNPSRA